MEIAPGIHRIEAPLGDRFVCMYLLIGEERTLLIDTGIAGMPSDTLVPYMESLGRVPDTIDYVLNSHIDFDHTGGNGDVRDLAPNAVFMCHELDRPMIDDVEAMIAGRYSAYKVDHGFDESEESLAYMREFSRHVPVDISLSGGERLHLGGGWAVEILHTPGHSRGHVSVYDARSRTMLVMDAVLWNAVLTAEGAPAFPPTYRYVDTYLATTQRLQGYALDLMATSHYPLARGEGAIAEFLGETRAFVDRVETALRGALQANGGPMTMMEIIAEISPMLGGWSEPAGDYLIWPLSGHVERLALYGLVETGRRDGLVTLRWHG